MFITAIFLATIAFMPQQAEATCGLILANLEPLVFVETETDKVALTKDWACNDEVRFTFEFEPDNDCSMEVVVKVNFTDAIENESSFGLALARDGNVEGKISVGGNFKRKSGESPNRTFGATPFTYQDPFGEFRMPLSESDKDLIMRMTKYDPERNWNKLHMRWRHVGDKKFTRTLGLQYNPYDLNQAAAMCAAKLDTDGLAEEAADNGDPKPESDQPTWKANQSRPDAATGGATYLASEKP